MDIPLSEVSYMVLKYKFKEVVSYLRGSNVIQVVANVVTVGVTVLESVQKGIMVVFVRDEVLSFVSSHLRV